MTLEERIKRARVQLVLREPFFGRLVLRLDMVEDVKADTIWTDGRRIGYRPDFVNGLTDLELQGVLVHEVMHCANLHPYRREGRDSKKWNIACDLAINGLIGQAGFSLPSGVLHDSKLDGQAAERIYLGLPDQDPQAGGAGSFDEVRDGGGEGGFGQAPRAGGSSEDVQAAAEEWRGAVVQAAGAAAGKLPAGFDRLIKRIRRGRVDWRAVLRQFLNQVRACDYTWSRPSRRHISSGLILPSMRSIECGLVVFAFDTSGSMCQSILDKAWAECVSALEDVRPEAYLIACDSKVQRIEHIEGGDPLPDKLNLPGGGGTDFRPVFDRIATDGLLPAVVVYFTDLDGCFPSFMPGYPVLWITDDDKTLAPFGLTLPVLS